MVRQQWQRVQDGEAAVAESSRCQDSSGRRLEMVRQQWQRIKDNKAAAADDLRYLGQQWLHMHTTPVQQDGCARQHGNITHHLRAPSCTCFESSSCHCCSRLAGMTMRVVLMGTASPLSWLCLSRFTTGQEAGAGLARISIRLCRVFPKPWPNHTVC